MTRESFAWGISLFVIAVVVLSSPVIAASVAVYGSTSGFIPERHADQFSVAYSIPGSSGDLFDLAVGNFTARSIDVIFIGNDDNFSSLTASAIEEAVWDGRILVISHPATGRFGDSLPVLPAGTAEGSTSLQVTNLNNGISREVFSGLKKTFNATGPVPERLTGTLKPGAISLMKSDTGEPALAYREYGSGYVVEWLLPTPQTYLGEDTADTVNFRILRTLLATVNGGSTPGTTTVPTTVPTTVLTTSPAQTTTAASTGNALIQSSPLGAMVFFDGVYQGKTPLKLDGIPAGYHSIKMTMDGYYDFDGSAYIVNGETVTVFGSLPAQDKPVTIESTPVPTTPVPTTPPAQTDPISNPTVIAAGIGIITAGIGAFATIYTQKLKEKKE